MEVKQVKHYHGLNSPTPFFFQLISNILVNNKEESLQLLNENAIPYVEDKIKKLRLESTQYAINILDVFAGQMTEQVIDELPENPISPTRPFIKKKK